MVYTLNKWGVTSTPNPFTAPECSRTHLSGFREEDQQHVLTSPITGVNGRIITTQSGSTYFLGEPNPEYLAYLESIGYEYDEENPIKDKRR